MARVAALRDTVAVSPVVPVAPASVTADARVAVVVRLALYLMVFSIPFEFPDRKGLPVEIPTLTAAIFLFSTLLEPRRAFGKIPSQLGWFLAYLYVFVLAAIVRHTDYGAEVTQLFLLLLEGVLVFWATANLMRDEKTARGVLISIGLACATLSLLSLAGVGKTSHAVYTGGERLTVFGQNANNTAMVLSIGAVALGGLGYVLQPSWPKRAWLIWPLGAAVGLAIVKTGSRGGLIALGGGLLAFMIGGRTAWLRIRNIAVGTLAMGALLGATYASPMMRNRLEQSATEGNLAGREEIFPELIQMFGEKPVLGWGPVTNKYELGIRLHEIKHPRRDAHNMVLEVLTAAGLVGAMPFLVGFGVCAFAAWRARHRLHGILPAAFVAILFVANMSGNRIANKIFWVVLAYGVAATSFAPATTLTRRTA